jgi:hypothetical protein
MVDKSDLENALKILKKFLEDWDGIF